MINRTIRVRPLLSSKNTELSGSGFMKEYQDATSVFNGFYGAIAMAASDALTEANDAYEETHLYRMEVKKSFKDAMRSWQNFWDTLRILFEEKHDVYIDFVNNSVADMKEDLDKLYYCIVSSLLKARVTDAYLRARLYKADLLTHELNAIYVRYIEGLVRETNKPRLAETFAWADPQHIMRYTHALLRKLCPVDISMDNNIILALQIIGSKAVSADRQDAAAIRALELEGNESHREAMAEDIALYKSMLDKKQREEREAKEAYERKRTAGQDRRKRKPAVLTKDAIAERLGEKYKVTKAK